MLSNCLKKWIIGLPMIIKESREDNNLIKLPEQFIKLKDILMKYNLNSYELIIKDIPKIFDNNYQKAVSSIKKYLGVDNNVSKFIDDIAQKIKNKFIFGYKGSIAGCYKQWQIENNLDFSNVIFEGKGKDLHQLLKNVNYDNNNAVNQISLLISGYNVFDWATNRTDKLLEAIDALIVSSKKDRKSIKKEKKLNVSPMGKMFQNNIESIIDEFADSISNEEKINILSSFIDKYTGEK